jgi:hypothetical protein
MALTDNAGGTSYTSTPLRIIANDTNFAIQAYYAANVTAGPKSFTNTVTESGGTNAGIAVVEVTSSGVIGRTSTVDGAAASNGAWTGSSITTTGTNDFVFVGAWLQATLGMTNSPFTQLDSDTVNVLTPIRLTAHKPLQEP